MSDQLQADIDAPALPGPAKAKLSQPLSFMAHAAHEFRERPVETITFVVAAILVLRLAFAPTTTRRRTGNRRMTG